MNLPVDHLYLFLNILHIFHHGEIDDGSFTYLTLDINISIQILDNLFSSAKTQSDPLALQIALILVDSSIHHKYFI